MDTKQQYGNITTLLLRHLAGRTSGKGGYFLLACGFPMNITLCGLAFRRTSRPIYRDRRLPICRRFVESGSEILDDGRQTSDNT